MSSSEQSLQISQCRIIAGGQQGSWYAVEPDQTVWNLILEEDPAGFVDVPVRIVAAVAGDNQLIPLSLERL